jgi:hypothetical protein
MHYQLTGMLSDLEINGNVYDNELTAHYISSQYQFMTPELITKLSPCLIS